jgi:hypothetical protein
MSRTVLAALLLVTGLGGTGCASGQPDTAAVVAGVRITNQQVEELTREAVTAGVVRDPVDGREEVLGLLVVTELGRRVAAERSITVVPAPEISEAAASSLGPDSKLARAIAEWAPLDTVLSAGAAPAQPSDDDVRVIVAALRRDPRVPAAVSTGDLTKSIRANAEVPYDVGLRNLLRSAADRYGLLVNPRYGRLLIRQLPLLAESTVTDRPAA